ncbi:MAG: hypothetical protein FD154_2492 [Elusimicrobia bacterium]|nr:MAG: hypothetical protein FD154_2492 [Elusimicrobiota bacterium]
MKNNKLAVLAALVLLAGCAAAPEKRISETFQAALQAEKRSDAAALAELAADIKPADLAPAALRAYPEATLDQLYKALRRIALFTPDSAPNALRLEEVFEEKVRRGTFEADHAEEVYGCLLQARLFHRARALKERFPAILTRPLPRVVTPDPLPSGQWLAYDVLDGGSTAKIKSLRLAKGPRVVVVTEPGCVVTSRAMREIMEDKRVGPAFDAAAVLVMRRFDPPAVLEARAASGLEQVYMARYSSDFPGVVFDGSPRFFFLRDGKAVTELRGWGDGGPGALRRLRRAMEEIGISLHQAY